jgi:hypothetical protein
MDQHLNIYYFRGPHFAPSGNTVVCAAARETVVSVFGGGGLYHSDGLLSAFAGAAVFRDETGELFLGVWGARKASRFRSALKRSCPDIETLNEPPPGRLVLWRTR